MRRVFRLTVREQSGEILAGSTDPAHAIGIGIVQIAIR